MRKNILFIALLIGGLFFITTNANAQFRKIPAAVTDSFKKKYPSATAVEWSDKISAFQASFTLDGAHYTARYNGKGQWQGSQKMIRLEDLPAAVKEGLSKSKYADWKTGTVTIHYLPDGKTQYGIFVSKSDLQRKNLLFSSEGQLLKDGATL